MTQPAAAADAAATTSPAVTPTPAPAPDVSVVMPIYNAEPYLREALDSAVGQTLKNIEIICVNDGSTDGSLDIMREYAARDGRIRIDDGPNGGYGRAMNRGIALARGRYLGILEPDDLLAPGMFERLVAVADRDDLDFVRADFKRFCASDAGGYTFTTVSICPGREHLYNRVLDPQADWDLLNVRMQNWTGITRTSFVREHGIRLHETPGARFQDNGLWLQCYLCARRIEYVDEPFYCHRDDNPNSSTNRTDLMFAMLDEWTWLRERLDEHLAARPEGDRTAARPEGDPEGDPEAAPENDLALVRMFQYRKFQNCSFAYFKLADELQLPYLERFGAELSAAQAAGELDRSLFTDLERKKLDYLMNDPAAYRDLIRQEKVAQAFGGAPANSNRERVARMLFYVRAYGLRAAVGHALGRLRPGHGHGSGSGSRSGSGSSDRSGSGDGTTSGAASTSASASGE